MAVRCGEQQRVGGGGGGLGVGGEGEGGVMVILGGGGEGDGRLMGTFCCCMTVLQLLS
jgi:hypothetical protein